MRGVTSTKVSLPIFLFGLYVELLCGDESIADALSPETCTSAFTSKLFDWFSSKGGVARGVALQGSSSTERGLVATEDLVEGTTVLSVPVALTVPVQRSAATPLGQSLLRAAVEGHVPDEKSLDGMLLATWLLHETSQLDSSWSTYLDSLPSFLTTPFNLSSTEIQACIGGIDSAEKYIARGQRLLEQEFKLLQSLSDSTGFDVTRERYLWARFMSFSRTFTVARLRLNIDSTIHGLPELPQFARDLWSRSKASDEASVLVPLADMLNHAQTPNCDWTYSGGDGFTIRTKRAIAVGEELRINYGTKQNQLWLAHYGFVEEGTPGDKWDLPLSVHNDTRNPELVVLRIDAGNPTQPDELQELLDAFRNGARRLLEIPSAVDSLTDKESAVRVESAALRLLLESLRHEEQPFEAISGAAPVCAAYRENSRRLLGTWRAFVERALALVDGTEPPDVQWLTVPRFVRYARLYFGLWLNGQGGSRLAKSKVALEQARPFGKMSFFDAVYADD